MTPLADRDLNTICAVSTPPGIGGISVIRVSGEQSLYFLRKAADFLPAEVESHKLYFGRLKDPLNSEILDEVLISYFKKGHSFTGEEVIEISCHGSPVLVDAILSVLIRLGARLAGKGEFTYRAFMNNKLDLVQAESVLALIESKSKKAAALAQRQLQGALSLELNTIESELLWMAAHMEASIDFSTEGLQIVETTKLSLRMKELSEKLKNLINSYKSGKLIKDGIWCTLVGRTNVGKSSLLNLLVESERAIVTDIPGTTRDLVTAETTFSGIKFVITDTAGLRKSTTDQIEKIGMERSKKALTESDLNIFVFDLAKGLTQEDQEILNELDPKETIILGNKADLASFDWNEVFQEKKGSESKFFQKTESCSEFLTTQVRSISALDMKERSPVLELICKHVLTQEQDNEVVVSNARHFENISKALSHLVLAEKNLQNQMGAEFVAMDLKEAVLSIQQILGKAYDDQIMDRVFKEFCLGK
ncbi:MAG: tRNA uridine-5-carboxymethylaminomethyl(34) synthesis GTPase MnmE [Bdellovibrionota bacterium]